MSRERLSHPRSDPSGGPASVPLSPRLLRPYCALYTPRALFRTSNKTLFNSLSVPVDCTTLPSQLPLPLSSAMYPCALIRHSYMSGNGYRYSPHFPGPSVSPRSRKMRKDQLNYKEAGHRTEDTTQYKHTIHEQAELIRKEDLKKNPTRKIRVLPARHGSYKLQETEGREAKEEGTWW